MSPSLLAAATWAGPDTAGNPDPQRVASSPVGTLPGSFTVTDRGAASFSIPLALPAAAAGLEPNLALSYSSASGAGELGVGWSLSGQSAIHRCPHTLAHDGDTRGVRVDDKDALCLDGARLMLSEGEPFTLGAVYRPRIDDLTRVRVIPGSEDGELICAGGYGFELDHPDGTRTIYGCTRDATVFTPQGPLAWSRARVRDRRGNTLSYGYHAEQLEGADVDHVLVSIDYGAHEDLHGATRRVRLIWEPRPDIQAGYFLGAPQRSSQRLASISSYAPDGLATRYELDYATPSITGRSLLTAVRQCDGEGVCKPATTFDYGLGELALEPVDDALNFDTRSDFPHMDRDGDPDIVDPEVLAQAVLDSNGDGRTDQLLAVGGLLLPEGRGWETWTSQPGADHPTGLSCGSQDVDFELCVAAGGFPVYEDERSAHLPQVTGDWPFFGLPPLYAADYDGDGFDDAYSLGPDVFKPGWPHGGARVLVARGLEQGGVVQHEFDPGIGAIWQFSGADQTGEGLGDLLLCGGDLQLDADDQPRMATGSWHLVPNDPDEGFVAEAVIDLGLPCSSFDKLLEFDHDGDGQASTLMIPAWDAQLGRWSRSAEWGEYQALRLDPHQNWAASLEPTGLPADLAQRWRPAVAQANNADLDEDFPRSLQGYGLDRVLDINADGLPDVLRYELAAGDGVEQLAMIQDLVADQNQYLEWGAVRAWINTGAGFVPGEQLIVADRHGRGLFQRFSASTVLDFDGDGALDWLMPRRREDPEDKIWDWSVWLTRADGFELVPEVLEHHATDFQLHMRSHGTFDLDGDAQHDIGLFSNNRWQLFEHAGELPDRLVGVRNGLGETIEVEYASLTDFDLPEDHFEREGCVYPQHCDRAPGAVVIGHSLDTGDPNLGDRRRFEHRYGMARGDRLTRSGLGFAFHEQVELDANDEPIARHRVEFSHAWDTELGEFPFAGVAVRELDERRDPDGGRHVLTQIQRSPEVWHTSELSYQVHVSQTRTRSFELETCATTWCSVEELSKEAMTRELVDTVFARDDHGLPTLWTATANTGPGTGVVTYRHEASYQHDPQQWLLGLQTSERVSFTQPGVATHEHEWAASYDPQTGEMLTRTVEPDEPELYLHTTFAYDEHGNPTSVSAVDFWGATRSSTAQFDEYGVFPVYGENALGQGASLRWDTSLGTIIEATDLNGVRTVADFDGLGHAMGIRTFAGELPLGDDASFSYEMLAPDPFDGAVLEIRSETAGHGYALARYDRLGRVVETREPALDGLPRVVSTRYDRLGRVEQESLPAPLGQLPAGHERYKYDFADRLIRHELPDGALESWMYDGLQSWHIGLDGAVELERYDLGGRLVESVRGLASVDEERMCFDYGPFERLVAARPDCVQGSVVAFVPGEAPPTPKTYAYDDLGRMVFSEDPQQGARSYVYNGHGELDSYVDAKGQAVDLFRDALGRVVERVDADGLTTWVYDIGTLGALHASFSPDGHSEQRHYDAFGRLEGLTKTIAGEPYQLGFSYDAFNRLEHVAYPQAEGMAAFWTRNVYAANGDLQEVFDGGAQRSLWRAEDVDSAGRLTRERFGNGVVSEHVFNPHRGLLERIETRNELDETLQELEYGWRTDGTLDWREDLRSGQREEHKYDVLDRLISTRTRSGEHTVDRHFAYDSLGNLAFASERGDYDYDPQGRLSHADGSTHEWDANGNLIARTGARAATLSYAAFDKPFEVSTDAGTTSFEYDAGHARVYRYDEANSRETVYVGGLYERHDDGLVREHHYLVPGGAGMVAVVVDSLEQGLGVRSTRYLHDDHLGSVETVSDEFGEVLQRLAFDAWGERRDPGDWTLAEEFVELDSLNVGYTGHELQTDAGLINMGGRLYDPHLGRMASADPFIVAPLSAQGWNRFAYVLNQPTGYTDPSGYEPYRPGAGVEQDRKSKKKKSDSGANNDIPRGASGVMGYGEGRQGPGQKMVHGGSSTSRTAKASEKSSDRGPSSGAGMGGSGNRGAIPTVNEMVAGMVIRRGLKMIAEGVRDNMPTFNPKTSDPVLAMAEAMLRPESPSQERRRRAAAQDAASEVINGMQNPPDHVRISIEVTMLFIGGDAEMIGSAGKLALEKLSGEGAKRGALSVAAGVVKKKGKKRGPKQWPHGPHNQTIKQRIQDLKGQGHTHTHGGNLKEEVVPTPGGHKGSRRPDITTITPSGKTYRENVGRRARRTGDPVKRERQALDDLEAATGTRPGFTPYD